MAGLLDVQGAVTTDAKVDERQAQGTATAGGDQVNGARDSRSSAQGEQDATPGTADTHSAADATATPPTTSAKATPRWSSEDDLQALVLSSSITELDMSLEAVSLLIFAVQVGLAAFPSLQYAIDC